MGSKHHEAPTPTRLEQTLVVLQQAKIDADAGKLLTAADLFLCAVTEAGWINGVVRTVSEGIPGLPHEFVGPKPLVDALKGLSKKEAAALNKQAGRVVAQPRRGLFGDIFPEAEKAKMLMWGTGIGVCPMQRIPVNQPAEYGRPRVTFRMIAWNPRTLRYDHAQGRWAIITWGGEVWIDEHPDEFCLFRPYGDVKPWELAPWKYTVKAYLMGRDAEYDRVRHSAMNGPIVYFKGGEHTTPQNLKDADIMMATMERRAKATLQQGESIEVVAPPAGDLAGVYRDILVDAKEEVAIGWLGNSVVTTGTGGGLGATGEMWERMTARRIGFIASALERFEQQEVIDIWAPQQIANAMVGILYDTRPPSERDAEDVDSDAPFDQNQPQPTNVSALPFPEAA